jgi:gelsolin
MQKQKTYNIAETNIANLGSDLEKKVRQAAAETEPAWAQAGKQVGLQIWRIEKFQVKSWPKDQYGSFFSGDSYIVLHTYKKKGGDALQWDVHFWLGEKTSQDEAGTAAYKTVELDDLLGGAPVQHREVQGHESDMFLTYFNNQIKIMEGGIDSGFKHVEPEKYRPRLLHLKGKKKVRVTEVELNRSSLNSGDVFVLDNGLTLYQWNGKKSGPQEKMKGAQLTKATSDERKGKAQINVLEEGDSNADFWKLLGGMGAVKSAEEGGDDNEAEKDNVKRLFQLSDASGQITFKEVATGSKCKRNLLDSNDVFILDTGAEVFARIGKGASVQEKQKALGFAQDYLKKYNRPSYLPIARILEGGENEVFESALK